MSTSAPAPSEAATATQQAPPKSKRSLLIKIFVGLLLVGFIIYVIVDLATTNNTRRIITDFLDWVEDNPAAGVFAFIGVYFIATIFFIPGLILTLGAGFVFANALGLGVGILLATVSVFFGASFGSCAAFLIGRYLLRDCVSNLTKKYVIFEAIDAALKDKGLRIIILLRLSPLVPYNVFNYVCGVTSVSFRDYAIGMFGILPGTFLYVLLGSSAGSLVDSSSSGDNSTVRIVSIVVGVVFAILGVYATTYYAKKELNKILSQRQEVNAATSAEGGAESPMEGVANTVGNEAATDAEGDVEAQNETGQEEETYQNEEKVTKET
mmetsp:Transcript_30353/g.45821  ORF Transcript_30353/g.45821 Transcript_30353/m.45821 type:complete len:323 (+) Transcript_30353:91-1059(+)